jgi:hypothetical protein
MTSVNGWLVCESILRVLISIVTISTYFLWEEDYLIDADNLENLALFVLQISVVYYTIAKSYYAIQRARVGMFEYLRPKLLYFDIAFSKFLRLNFKMSKF